MTQQNNTTNWVIQGSNGQPQMIKLVQSAGKSISGIMTSAISGQPVKIFKAAASNSQEAQTFSTSQPQVIRTIGHKTITKTVPIQMNSMPKGTKTIRLTPTQMQNIKFVNSPQKIQLQNPTATTTTTIPVVQQSQVVPAGKSVSPSTAPILQRKRQDPLDLDYTPEAKRSRKSDKVGKGLRHFSMKVCEKVRKKGTTTYNEVADELVGEFTNPASNNALADQYDQKNIRRRVYDALNVLMAMNIISKEKKEIKWIGLPTNSLQECVQLEKEKQKKLYNIREKKKQLHELILNQIAFKNLAQRNKQMEETHGPPPPNSTIQLPFIVVNTNKKTVIDCSISNDKLEYLFQFNDKFEINDDVQILKSIGMVMGLDTGECSQENLEKIKAMVPKSLEDYVIQIASGSINDGLEQYEASGSSSMLIDPEDPSIWVETQMDEENSRQSSSFDPLSPGPADYSEEDSDLSSDID